MFIKKFLKMNKFQPKVSIITVTYNAEQFIERCILNISGQTYLNIEHIIVDGNSTDRTLSIIKRMKGSISGFISEDDSGLYDAMNKGIKIATGDYLWFINADDQIFSDNTLENVVNQNPENQDIYFGETMIVDAKGNEIGMRRHATPEVLTYKTLKKGMKVSHQSILVKREIAELYDLKYRFSADYDWVVKALKTSETICNTHLVLSKFNDEGLTKQNMKTGLKERFAIMTKHYGFISTVLHHIPIAFRFVFFYLKNKRV